MKGWLEESIMMKRWLTGCLVAVSLSGCWGGGGGSGGGIGLPAVRPLNDTGITLCGDYAFAPGSGIHNNNVSCTVATQTTDGTEVGNGGDPVPGGQDGHYGRDVTDADNSDGDSGFSYTRLGANGNELVIQDGVWNEMGLEANGTKWSCVRDEVTGLVWEVKTDNGGLHDKDWNFTWYSSNAFSNGGIAGMPDTGAGSGSDDCLYSSRCDTEKYVTDVNATYLCGASDWRLPTRAELKSLRHLGGSSPAVDAAYFPNTQAAYFWTASPRASNSSQAWIVAFDTGAELTGNKTAAYSVRLVRDAN